MNTRVASVVGLCVLGVVALLIVRCDPSPSAGPGSDVSPPDRSGSPASEVESSPESAAVRRPVPEVLRFVDATTGEAVEGVELVPAERGRALVLSPAAWKIAGSRIERTELEELWAGLPGLWAVAEGYEIAEVDASVWERGEVALRPARPQTFRWLGVDGRPVVGKKFTVTTGALPAQVRETLKNVPPTEPHLHCRTAFTGWSDREGACRIPGIPDGSYHVTLVDRA